MLKLAVLNECIALLGQAPLVSITDSHPLRAPAIAALSAKNTLVQQRGWWFNQEVITVSPDTAGRIILPGDCIKVQGEIGLAKRGPILYDLTNSTDLFAADQTISIVRLLDFELLEEVAAEYICALTLAQFQLDYDGDSDKQSKILRRAEMARSELNAEHTRQSRVNRITNSFAIGYISSIRNSLRYPIR